MAGFYYEQARQSYRQVLMTPYSALWPCLIRLRCKARLSFFIGLKQCGGSSLGEGLQQCLLGWRSASQGRSHCTGLEERECHLRFIRVPCAARAQLTWISYKKTRQGDNATWQQDMAFEKKALLSVNKPCLSSNNSWSSTEKTGHADLTMFSNDNSWLALETSRFPPLPCGCLG